MTWYNDSQYDDPTELDTDQDGIPDDEDMYPNGEDENDLNQDMSADDELLAIASGESSQTVAPQPVQAAQPTVIPQPTTPAAPTPQSTGPSSFAQLVMGPTTPAPTTQPAPTGAKSFSEFVLGPSTPAPTRRANDGTWGGMIEGAKQDGLWGPQWGAPIGGGDVKVGGTVTQAKPSYITSITQGGGAVAANTSVRPSVNATLPDKMDTSSREANIKQWAPVLMKLQQDTGLSAEAVGAIIIAENGGGQSDISKNANNYFSIHYAGLPGQQGKYKDTPAAVYKNAQDNLQDFVTLISTSDRYAKAWAVRNDPEKFWGELINAGYIEPGEAGRANWLKNLRSGRDQFSEIAGKDLGVQAQAATQVTNTAINRRRLEGITPSQAEIAQTDKDGWALCGPISVMAMSAAVGKPISLEQAKALGARNGWTSDDGMSNGYRGVLGMFKELGMDVKYQDGVDWSEVARRVQSGQPVILNAPTVGGKIGHYFVVEGYDPQTGKFNLGNSLLSLNDRIHGRDPWVTPEQMAQMQSRTTLNMQPTGMLMLADGTRTVAQGGPSSAQPTTTSGGITMTRGVAAGSTGEPAIRGNVGNRPITLWDIALGDWQPGPAPVEASQPIQVIQAPPPRPTSGVPGAPGTSRGATTTVAADADVEAQNISARQYNDWLQQYMEQNQRIADGNVGLAQSGVDDWVRQYGGTKKPADTSGDGGDTGFSPTAPDENAEYYPSALNEYPMPEPPPPTPKLDAKIKEWNEKKEAEWRAAGADPDKKPPRVYTSQELYDIAVDSRQKYMDAEQKFATDYYNATEAQKAKVREEVQRKKEEIIGRVRAAAQRPTNEYNRFLEENAAPAGDSSVTVTTGAKGTPYERTNVLTTPEEIMALPEAPDDVYRDTIRAVNESNPELAGGAATLAEVERRLRDLGFVTKQDKERMLQDLSLGAAVSTERAVDREVASRNHVEISDAMIDELRSQNQLRPMEDVIKEWERANGRTLSFANDGDEKILMELQRGNEKRPFKEVLADYYAERAATSPEWAMQSPAQRVLSIFGQGVSDLVGSSAGGLAAIARGTNMTGLEQWANKQWAASRAASIQEGKFGTKPVNPESMNWGEMLVSSAPSLAASFAIGIPVAIGVTAAGGGPAAAVGLSTAGNFALTMLQEGGSGYTAARKAGATDAQATAVFLSRGSVSALIENVPIFKAINKIPGAQRTLARMSGMFEERLAPTVTDALLKTDAGRRLIANSGRLAAGGKVATDILENFWSEGGQEALQEAVGIAAESIYEDKTWAQISKQLHDQLPQAFLVGGAMGGIVELGVGAATRGRGATGDIIRGSLAPELSNRGGQADIDTSAIQQQANQRLSDYYAQNQPERAVGGQRIELSGPQAVPNTEAQQTQQTGEVTQAGENAPIEAPQAGIPDIAGYRDKLLKGTARVNERNLSTRSQSFDQVLDTLPTPPDVASRNAQGNPVTTLERVEMAADALAQAQQAFGGQLNADQRAAILNYYGVTDANQRANAAMAGLQMHNAPDTEGIVKQTTLRLYGGQNNNANPDPVAFNREFQRGYAGRRGGQTNAPQTGQTGQTEQVVQTPQTPQAPTTPETVTTETQAPTVATPTTPTTTEQQATPGRVPDNFVVTDETGNRSARGDMIISNKRNPEKNSFMGFVRAAYRAAGLPDDFSAVQSKMARAVGRSRPPTINDAIDAIRAHNPDQADVILQHLGIDGVAQEGDLETQQAQTPQNTPQTVTAPESTPGTPQTPSRPKYTDNLNPGERRVYVRAPGYYDQAFFNARTNRTITSDGDTLQVYDNPNALVGQGMDNDALVPAIVKEEDVIENADGTISLRTPGGKLDAIAMGGNAAPDVDAKTRTLGDELSRKQPPSYQEAWTNLDRVDAPKIEGTKARFFFQKGEISSRARKFLANAQYIKDLANITSDVVQRIVERLRTIDPTIDSSVSFEAFMWTPGVMGFAPTGGTKGVWVNPMAIFQQAVWWATTNGFSIESEEFRRYFAGLYVSTLIHEVSHHGNREGVDESGHGGKHKELMMKALNDNSVVGAEELVQEIYELMGDNNLSALGGTTEAMVNAMGMSLGQPQIEAIQEIEQPTTQQEVTQPVVEAETEPAPPVEAPKIPTENRIQPTGNSNNVTGLLDADQAISNKGRSAWWYGTVVNIAKSVVFDGDNSLPKNLAQRDINDVAKRHERADQFQKDFKQEVERESRRSGKKAGTILNVFQALNNLSGKYPNILNAVAEKIKLNGYTYTDDAGQQQSVIFPHAQGATNGLDRTTEPGVGNGPSPSRNVSPGQSGIGGNRGGAGATGMQESRSAVQPSPSVISDEANPVGTSERDGRVGYIDPRTGAGAGRQVQPPSYVVQRSSYVPGAKVKRGEDGRVVKVKPGKNRPAGENVFWSDSNRRWVKANSHTEVVYMQELEDAMNLPEGDPKRVLEWTPDTMHDGTSISVPFIIEEDNRYGTYNPDFFVSYADGTNKIVEIKSNDAIDKEEGYVSNAVDKKLMYSWRVARKVMGIISYLPNMQNFGPTTYEILGSGEARFNEGRKPSAIQQARLDAYAAMSEASSIPFKPEFEAITDPAERQAAIYKAVRRDILDSLELTTEPQTGRQRNATTMVFMARPELAKATDVQINRALPEARPIIAEAKERGVAVTGANVSAKSYHPDAPVGAVLQARGDVVAVELMAAELAQAHKAAEDPGTFLFREDSRGPDTLHSFEIPFVDAQLEDALLSVENRDGPTLTVIPNENGGATITLSSRTPNGSLLERDSFNATVDQFRTYLEDDLGVEISAPNIIRGVITHFGGNVDNAITRLKEELGATPIGEAFTDKTTYRDRREFVGRPSVAAREGEPQGDFPRLLAPAFLNQEEDIPSVPAAQMNRPPGGNRPNIQPPGGRVGGQNAQIPGFDATKFSRDVRGPIKAAAQTIFNNHAVPQNVVDQTIRALGLHPREYANSYARTLTPLEQAAILMNLAQQKQAMDVTAQRFATTQQQPTQDEMRDFVLQGMQFRAMYAQLTGRPAAIRDASKILTNTKQGATETPDQFAKRIMDYAKTRQGKHTQFARNLIGNFHNASILGATPHQIDTAWEQILNPQTTIGDWMLGIMYSAMLGARTAINAIAFNTAEVFWRGGLDMLTTVPYETIQGAWNAAQAGGWKASTVGDVIYGANAGIERGAKISLAEGIGFLLGIQRGLVAFGETILFGASTQQYALEDLPPNRLTNNKLGILSTPANMLGYGMEIFWNRFFQGADAFAKVWAYSMQMGREAALESARRNNGKVDLRAAQALFDTPTTEMMAKSQRVALETAFQGEMGSTGNTMARVQNVLVIGRVLFPFLRTLYHSANRGIERTPLGMLIALQRVWATADGNGAKQKLANLPYNRYIRGGPTSELQNVRPFHEVLRDSVVGTVLMYGFDQLLTQGLMELTGQPPDDDKEREQWLREGKIPFGISFPKANVNFLGLNYHGQYISYTNMGPIGLGLAALAEIKDTERKLANKKPDQKDADIYGHALANFMSSFIELTWLSSASQMLGTMSQDPRDSQGIVKSSFGRVVESQITSRIPFGATGMMMGQYEDPYNRYPIADDVSTKRLMELLATRMPMQVPFLDRYIPTRDDLLPQLDVWGFPVPNPYYGKAVLSPVRIQPNENRSDPVDMEITRLQDLGVDVRPSRPSHDYEGHKFTAEEYYEWSRRVGQNAYWLISRMKDTPTYQNAQVAGIGSKEEMIKAAYDAARETAWESMAIIDPGAEPQREPEYYGVKEEAAKRGIPWWQYEKEVKNSVEKWSKWQDAVKNGRPEPHLTPEELQQGATYSKPGMKNKLLTLDKKTGLNEVKSVIANVDDIPFRARP